MISQTIALIILLLLGITYLYAFSNVQNRFLKHLSQPKKNIAVMILYFSSLIAASVNMVYAAGLSSDAISYFLKSSTYLNILFFSISFFAISWIFSLALFRLSFLIVGFITPENEDDELIKNNIELAILHAVILISLAIMLAPALVKIEAQFIPYPKMPY
jgi:hypothetical protein